MLTTIFYIYILSHVHNSIKVFLESFFHVTLILVYIPLWITPTKPYYQRNLQMALTITMAEKTIRNSNKGSIGEKKFT